MTDDTSAAELIDLLDAIARAAECSVGVNAYEYLLVDLRELIESNRIERASVVAELERLAAELPWGAVEALEFTMHALRWPEVRHALESHRDHGPDFRTRNLAAQVLEAYHDDWPSGEIYDTYRKDGS